MNHRNKNYKAIILAAGQGTRLRPLTNHIPKCMVKVSGKPILKRQLEVLTSAGIEEIIVVTGYMEEKIDDPRITKVYNADYATTNMIYSLFCAEEYLRGGVIVSYGDIIYSEEVLRKLMASNKDVTIASDEHWLSYWESRCEDPLSDAETFKKGEDRKVQAIGQKAESVDDIEGQFIGLVKLSATGCNIFKDEYHACKNNKVSSKNAWGSGRSLLNAYMTDILNHLAGKDELHYVPIQRGWFEVDNQKDLQIANKVFV